MSTLELHDHRLIGATQSLCPECLRVVAAKIIVRAGRVYFRKFCEEHGVREDFVCSDERWWDRNEFSLPGRKPIEFGVEPLHGCPYDCGLCTEHEQHTCIAVLEITSSCNLTCPMCYASSAPGGVHVDFDDCRRAIDRLVEVEGRPEVLQLSGGEPTVHPDFERIFEYACAQPIDIVMINTNGVRIARDPRFVELVARLKHRCEIYLQFDGFSDAIHRELRGENLLDEKLRAIDILGEAGVRVQLVCTVQSGVNLNQVGRIAQFGLERSWITGASFQPATYTGRHVLPEALEERVTFPDVINAIVAHGANGWTADDFLPLPCAHPNMHTLAYAYRENGKGTPMTRFIDIANHLDLLANGITFDRQTARSLIETFLSRNASACGPNCDCGPSFVSIEPPANSSPLNGAPSSNLTSTAERFFSRAMAEELSPADVFRITTTSFMDPFNFDIRQLMKSCVNHLLPTGHLIPFCAYNVLYREGHVPLPPLTRPIKRSPPPILHAVAGA